MDLLLINTIVSLLSAIAMFVAIIYILTYILGSFSSKSGTISPKLVLFSLTYFFGSTIFMFMGVEWLSGLSQAYWRQRPESDIFALNIGASALGLNALLHIICGLLTAFLYLRGRTSSSGLPSLGIRRKREKKTRSAKE